MLAIRDTKGTFHAKMGSIKGKNDMDLTEAGSQETPRVTDKFGLGIRNEAGQRKI